MQTERKSETLSDQAFLMQFENQTLNPEHFKHVGHLRLTWLYLAKHDVETSVKLVSSGIKAYAESLGASTKFHVTITDAMVRIMARRVEQMKEKDWSQFLDENADLLNNATSVLTQYFSEDLLFNEAARTRLIQPDLQKF